MTYADEEIIKALDTCADESEDCANCPFRIDFESCNRLTKIALELIKRQQAELEKRQWISVEDRLPDDHDNMMLAIVSGKPKRNIMLMGAVQLAMYSSDCGWIIEEYPEWNGAVVTHWMHLPEPPKGD